MKITYYILSDFGNIHEQQISTDDQRYIAHTDETVSFKDTFINNYGDVEEYIATRERSFEAIRQERISAYKEEIERYKRDLAIFENATSYEHYWKLLKNNRA